jgi:hypothetical protein
MAFDQTTRNHLQHFVNDARRVLEDEFTRQLQNDCGMDPNSGEIADLESLRHINDAQLETARILRHTLAHYRAAGDMDAKQGLDRIVREQAFTVLNRLAALRMAEARGLLVESVGNSFQAKGFQLYARLAGIGLGETGDAYRTYLFSVFDELSQDLPGLFDRFSPQGRLFPRESSLLQILALLNDTEIAPLWGEDETIGWIYQYFNSKEERKAMRDASQAPRNSRELAVRNQFFTPRYVVEFLVDNTLGRLWFNITGGKTDLRISCKYLLVKPNEACDITARIRDPRTLKFLDPACGSMHFGLYAFDVFVEIYREAWAWEQRHGPGSLDLLTQPQSVLKPLSLTYKNEVAFLRDVPRLIIDHNIFGVDIDSRAAQIASLALWLRAQRAWHDSGVKFQDRPQIGRGHIVAATAPPAERELRQQFVKNLDTRDAELFEKTLELLKGIPELGVLLQVERDLPHLIRQVYGGQGTGLFAQQEQEAWQQAEARLREALTEFAHAAKSTYQGRLFAHDALQGLRLIDLCREIFDVVLMNPPFGEASQDSQLYLDENYPASKVDLFAIFVSRGLNLLRPHGFLGAITNRVGFFNSQFETWRANNLFGEHKIQAAVDLGYGVLDAMVETAAYVITKQENPVAAYVCNLLKSEHKQEDLIIASDAVKMGNMSPLLNECALEIFDALPGKPFCHWIPEHTLQKIASYPRFENSKRTAKQGLATADDFRFISAAWEVAQQRIGERWFYFAKGGEYSPYWDDIHLVINWQEEGKEAKAYAGTLYNNSHWSRILKNVDYYFKPGLTYPERTTSDFAPRLLPAGCIFSATGQAIFFENQHDSLPFLALSNSRIYRLLLELFIGSGDAVFSGSAARHYKSGLINASPVPELSVPDHIELSDLAKRSIELAKKRFTNDETSRFFAGPALISDGRKTLRELVSALENSRFDTVLEMIEVSYRIDQIICHAYDFGDKDIEVLNEEYGPHPGSFPRNVEKIDQDALFRLSSLSIDLLIDEVSRAIGNSRQISKKSYFADRQIELLSHYFKVHPSIIVKNLKQKDTSANIVSDTQFIELISYAIGCIFGRWSTQTAKPLSSSASADIFESLPKYAPCSYELNKLHSPNQGFKISDIWVDDSSNSFDIVNAVESVIQQISGGSALDVWTQVAESIKASSVRSFLASPSGFFAFHLQQYSKSRRKAPIYWPLSTISGSYTLWIYYHSLNSQSLYTVINDFVEPKIKEVGSDVVKLRNKGITRSREDEKQLEVLQVFELELIELRDTLLNLAPNYDPNYDDGVQISAAPLWRLFRHKPWQKLIKETWICLERGDYDWAHLAMNYWPERVLEKCKTDKSVAIAHDLEHLYVEPVSQIKKARVRKKSRGDE